MGSVLDASAILAVVWREPGMSRVNEAIRDGAVVLSVNLAEAIASMVNRGTSESDIRRLLAAMSLDVLPFDEELAYRAGLLRTATRSSGLSLGDRACLALAERLGVPALTTDRIWGTLQLGIQIEVVR
jgi:PIN domain nuclease of toxin-antitoxin system